MLPKIARGGHDACSKVVLPDAVDDDTSGERMIRSRQRLGQSKAVAARRSDPVRRRLCRAVFLRRTKNREKAGRDLGSGRLYAAPLQQTDRRHALSIPESLDLLQLAAVSVPNIDALFQPRQRIFVITAD